MDQTTGYISCLWGEAGLFLTGNCSHKQTIGSKEYDHDILMLNLKCEEE